jgi:hypothetical protein
MAEHRARIPEKQGFEEKTLRRLSIHRSSSKLYAPIVLVKKATILLRKNALEVKFLQNYVGESDFLRKIRSFYVVC